MRAQKIPGYTWKLQVQPWDEEWPAMASELLAANRAHAANATFDEIYARHRTSWRRRVCASLSQPDDHSEKAGASGTRITLGNDGGTDSKERGVASRRVSGYRDPQCASLEEEDAAVAVAAAAQGAERVAPGQPQQATVAKEL